MSAPEWASKLSNPEIIAEQINEEDEFSESIYDLRYDVMTCLKRRGLLPEDVEGPDAQPYLDPIIKSLLDLA